MEWIQNYSDRPIPEPYTLKAEEKRVLFDLQRRAHLDDWDDKYKRAPLTAVERELLERFERRIKLGTVPVFGAVEFRFAPGEIFQVPDGVGAALEKMLPEKLRRLEWRDVRDLPDVPAVHIQTLAENLALITMVGDDGGISPHSPTTIEMKDGAMRWGDGAWIGIPPGGTN